MGSKQDRNVVLIILDTVRKDYFDEYSHRIASKSDTSFSQCRAVSTWSIPSHASIFTQQMPSEHGLHAENFGEDDFSDLKGKTFLDSLDHRSIAISANPYANSMYGFDELFDEFYDFIRNQALFKSALSPYSILRKTEGSKLEKAKQMFKESLNHEKPLRSLINCFSVGTNLDLSKLPIPGVFDGGAREITKAASGTVSGEEPFFMFVNYMDAHSPFRNLYAYDQGLHNASDTWNSNKFSNWELNKEGAATEQYKENYRNLYSASIDYLDRKVSQLIEDLEEKTGRETTIIITADHGENLGLPEDGGYFHHAGNMSEGLLHVPLEIINPPSDYPSNIDEFYSQLDLGDLIKAISKGEDFENANNFQEEIAAERIGVTGIFDPRDSVEFTEEEWKFWNRMIRCVYKNQKKYEWDSNNQKSVHNLDLSRPSWQQEIEKDFEVKKLEENHFSEPIEEYKKKAESESAENNEEEAIKEQLERLGYS